MIEMKCLYCGYGLRIDDRYVGQRGACKYCQGNHIRYSSIWSN